MTFNNLSYYLYDTKVNIKCDHIPLEKTPNSLHLRGIYRYKNARVECDKECTGKSARANPGETRNCWPAFEIYWLSNKASVMSLVSDVKTLM